MGKRTGNPRGRPKGARNQHTVEREAAIAAAAEAAAEALPECFKGDAHALLMLVYKDESKPMDLRLDAAKAAIRFEKPTLSSVQADVNLEADIRNWMVSASEEPE